MANFNLGDISAYERMLYGNVEDDPDLEAELLAIQNEMGDDDDELPSIPTASSRPKPAIRNNAVADIDRLARQISQEINVADDENDESVEDDPELLAELSAVITDEDDLPPPKSTAPIPQQQSTTDNSRDLIVLIEDRITNYTAAQKAAKEAGDAAKLRRLERGVQTLKEQLSKARAGRMIDRSEIPPPVTVAATGKSISDMPASPSMPEIAAKPTPPPISESQSLVSDLVQEKRSPPPSKPTVEQKQDSKMAILCQRRDEFRKAAVQAKQNGQKEAALDYFKTCKQFDKVIEAYENGQEVDLTGMPTLNSTQKTPTTSTNRTNSPSQPRQAVEEIDESVFDEKTAAAAFKAPPPPATIMEALQQRLEKYKSTAEKAQQDGDASKARRMGRIQKQYEDAIKAHRAGKPVDFDELPTPPGFGPIPVGSSASVAAAAAVTPKPLIAEKPGPAPAGGPATAGQRRPSPTAAASAPPAKMSKQEQELRFLLERQQQFKAAALASKKRGDLNSAKHYLKQALGIDQMISACKNGLRIDVSSIPTPPQLKTGAGIMKPAIATADIPLAADISSKSATTEGGILAGASYEDVFSTLEQDLIHQAQICERNREFYLNTGEVAKVTEFEKLSNGLKKDLAALRNCFKHGDPPPRFHYETRVFPSIKCFPELGIDDLEVSIIRGIQLKLPSGYEPKDADIYVKYDFGYPKETPQTGKTPRIKDTNSPVFDFTGTLRINAKSRQFLHMLKRIGVKFEIFQKGGFLRSDIPIGAAELKLVSLETQPLIHQSLDIMANRKAAGGKLEVKVRVREPLVQKQAEVVREKWLVIDQFTVPSSATALAANRAAASAAFGSRPLGGGRIK